jgi:hypothetical protein
MFQALVTICLVLLVIEVKSGFLSGGFVGPIIVLFTSAICMRFSYLYTVAGSRGMVNKESEAKDLGGIGSLK